MSLLWKHYDERKFEKSDTVILAFCTLLTKDYTRLITTVKSR
ncbi:hypothetical protein BC781_10373 [Sediminitomix flava]|uniref:Uncharacterized protein n=1 Tax=Sediminitomix flava TaxID=379075 RepID=A0A315Z9T3_SEDFL|nr:hypothetical protein BC781_10373 [Sediminitomix flava]